MTFLHFLSYNQIKTTNANTYVVITKEITIIFFSKVSICILGMVEGKMDEVLGCFSVPLDGRFTSIRTVESNLGNWVRQ